MSVFVGGLWRVCFECDRKSRGMFCQYCWPNGYEPSSKLTERERNRKWREKQNRAFITFKSIPVRRRK